MKRLLPLLFLLLLAPLAKAQNTFCASNLNCNVTGNWTFANANGAINPLQFSGSDIGAQINAANAAFPGSPIVIPPSSSCYSFSTPIVINAGPVPTSIRGSGATSTCLQYTASSGTAFTFSSGVFNGISGTISDMELMTTVSASTATGLSVGPSNTCSNCKVERMYIHGFQFGSITGTYHVEYLNNEFSTCSSAAGSIGVQTAAGAFADDTHISGGRIIGCATLVKIGNAFVVWMDSLLLQSPLGGISSTVWVDNTSGGFLNCNQCHWYNAPAGGATNWFNSSGPVAIVNSLFEDAKTTGSVTSFASQTASFLSFTNNYMLSGGESATEFVLLNNSVSYAYFVNNWNASTPQIPILWNTTYPGSLDAHGNHPNLTSMSEPLIAAGTGVALTGTGACATFTNQVGGSWAGAFKCTGTTGASTLTITFPTGLVAAVNGVACSVTDETTSGNLFKQGSHTTNSCTLNAASITQNDFFVWSLVAF